VLVSRLPTMHVIATATLDSASGYAQKIHAGGHAEIAEKTPVTRTVKAGAAIETRLL
jgi:hypothetical protein